MKNSSGKNYDLIVIGAGPAGMMAAGVASSNKKRVLLIEKNPELGKKLKITGGGRCNITNATFDTHKLLEKYGPAAKFLYSPFSKFGVQDTFDFFESRGLPLVTEARQRVFPETQKAGDVFKVLLKNIDNEYVEVLKNNPVREIHIDPEENTIRRINTKLGMYTAENYLIATGGYSRPKTGATGDGFGWLKNIGHTTNPPSPTIVPLRVHDNWVKKLSGTSLSFMKISFYVNGKRKFYKTGKILFTHFGLSGPLILNSAKKVSDLLHEGDVTASIDCYPDTDEKSLEQKVLKVFDNNQNKNFKNITKEICPHGMESAILEVKGGPAPDTKVHSITKEERKSLVKTMKSMPLKIAGLMGMDRAVISDGGVPLSEVNTRTMQSKLFSNLYLAGDILHINRPSGGYSLQLCWTTGYVAGQLGK